MCERVPLSSFLFFYINHRFSGEKERFALPRRNNARATRTMSPIHIHCFSFFLLPRFLKGSGIDFDLFCLRNCDDALWDFLICWLSSAVCFFGISISLGVSITASDVSVGFSGVSSDVITPFLLSFFLSFFSRSYIRESLCIRSMTSTRVYESFLSQLKHTGERD